jgi:predicted nucleotidyltransferase
MGVVRSSSAGRANVHTLVRENTLVAHLIEPLFSAEELLPEELLAKLHDAFCDVADSVVLFGSYARGDQNADSDVDLALVARDPSAKELLERAAAARSSEFRRQFGATLSPLIYDASEAAALHSTAPELFDSIRDDGIVLSGTRPDQWVTGG